MTTLQSIDRLLWMSLNILGSGGLRVRWTGTSCGYMTDLPWASHRKQLWLGVVSPFLKNHTLKSQVFLCTRQPQPTVY